MASNSKLGVVLKMTMENMIVTMKMALNLHWVDSFELAMKWKDFFLCSDSKTLLANNNIKLQWSWITETLKIQRKSGQIILQRAHKTIMQMAHGDPGDFDERESCRWTEGRVSETETGVFFLEGFYFSFTPLF